MGLSSDYCVWKTEGRGSIAYILVELITLSIWKVG